MLTKIKTGIAALRATYIKYTATPVRVYWDDGAHGSRVLGVKSGYFEAKSFVKAWMWGRQWCASNRWAAVDIQRPGTTLPVDAAESCTPAMPT